MIQTDKIMNLADGKVLYDDLRGRIDETAAAHDSTKANKADTVLDTTLSCGRKNNTTVGAGSFAFGYNNEASGAYSHAEGSGTTVKSACGHAEGSGSTVGISGYGSHAEGGNTTANGAYAHVEGEGTTASSYTAHAEGAYTVAMGAMSHAEGNSTTASGNPSHAEGNYSEATGYSSHAEGVVTSANGAYSHSEGVSTLAEGAASHVEGNGTVASGSYSHVFGMNNIWDTYLNWDEWVSGATYAVGDKVKRTIIVDEDVSVQGYICKTDNDDTEFDDTKWTSRNGQMNYAEIVGNGTDDEHLSNARMLDWLGNEYLKGDLYVGCNADGSGGTKVISDTDYASVNNPGVVKVSTNYGTFMDNAIIGISKATTANLKAGTQQCRAVVPYNQHESVYYALAKLAGANMASVSGETVGVYPDAQKQAIQKLFGLDGILGDYESATASKAYAIGETFVYNGKRYRATAAIAISDVIAPGTNCELCPLGLSDVQANGISVISNGVANIPKAGVDSSHMGVIYASGDYGVGILGAGGLYVARASSAQIKAGNNSSAAALYKPITPQTQHESVYYALAKLAGADMASASGETVGIYPQTQKTAIQSMLGIEANIPLVETVTGATVSITGMPNVRYICDTAISELTITPPASGSIVVRFTAGSNCIVSVPNTVKFPEWFDISSLEAGTTYEIIIEDGVYGGAMAWA